MSPRSSLVEKLPSVQITAGSISSPVRTGSPGRPRSRWVGDRGCPAAGTGAHSDPDLLAVQADLGQQLVQQLAGRPTNGRPIRSSLAPGASPMNISSASAFPAPNTTLVRVWWSGQRVQPRASSYTPFRSSRRSAASSRLTMVVAADGAGCRPAFTAKLGGSDRSHIAGVADPDRGIIADEAVTFAGRTSNRRSAFTADRYLPCGNWNGIAPLTPPPVRAWPSSAGAAWATRWPRRCGDGRYELLGPLGRGSDGAGADAVLLCVPDGQIAAPRRAIAPGPLVGHCSGATGLEPLAPHEAFSLHPLMTVTARGRAVRRGGRGDRREHPPRAGSRRASWRERSGCAPVASPSATGSPTTRPPRSPPTSWSRSRPRPSGWPPTPGSIASCWSRWSGRPSRTGPRSARAGAHRAGGPGRRGRPSPRQRDAIAERAPELLELFDALVDATRSLAPTRATRGGAAGMRTCAPSPSCAPPWRAAARRPVDRPRADDGRASTTATCR